MKYDFYMQPVDKFKEEKGRDLRKKQTAKGRIQAEKDMRDLIKNSLAVELSDKCSMIQGISSKLVTQ